MAKPRVTVIPRDVFDTLELSAEAFGGIGAGFLFNRDDASALIPNCLLGHLKYAGVPDADKRDLWERTGGFAGNDLAVDVIAERQGTSDVFVRVAWADYVAERGWVRGSR